MSGARFTRRGRLSAQSNPIVFTEDQSRISIKALCDYNKDLIKAASKDVRRAKPEVVLRV